MEDYKESESNPSGLLTLVANSATKPGTYMPTITVGSSNQTASLAFMLVITSAAKTADGRPTVGSRDPLPLATAG